jgi:hypothetical protein
MAWAPDYVTPAELADYVGTDDAEDVKLGLAIAAASRAVDRCTGRQFGLDGPSTRRYTARYRHARARWVADVDDIPTVSEEFVISLDTDGDLTFEAVVTAYDLRPMNAQPMDRPWTQVVFRSTAAVLPNGAEGEVQILGMWGWSAVPDPVKQATLLQASRLWVRKDSPYGIAGSPDAGSEMRLLDKVDPDVEVALTSYKRPRDRLVFA